eukprot:sb/3466407/
MQASTNLRFKTTGPHSETYKCGWGIEGRKKDMESGPTLVVVRGLDKMEDRMNIVMDGMYTNYTLPCKVNSLDTPTKQEWFLSNSHPANYKLMSSGAYQEGGLTWSFNDTHYGTWKCVNTFQDGDVLTGVTEVVTYLATARDSVVMVTEPVLELSYTIHVKNGAELPNMVTWRNPAGEEIKNGHTTIIYNQVMSISNSGDKHLEYRSDVTLKQGWATGNYTCEFGFWSNAKEIIVPGVSPVTVTKATVNSNQRCVSYNYFNESGAASCTLSSAAAPSCVSFDAPGGYSVNGTVEDLGNGGFIGRGEFGARKGSFGRCVFTVGGHNVSDTFRIEPIGECLDNQ